jgi:hypothetical protein
MSHTRATTIYENVMVLIQGDSNTLKKFDISFLEEYWRKLYYEA